MPLVAVETILAVAPTGLSSLFMIESPGLRPGLHSAAPTALVRFILKSLNVDLDFLHCSNADHD